MAEVQAILALAQGGWPIRRIARHLGVDRETVSRHLRLGAESATSKPASAPLGSITTDPATKPVLDGAPLGSVALAAGGPGDTTAGLISAAGPWRQTIERKLEAGLSARRIFQDLCEDHGYPGSYYSVRRLVKKLTATAPFRRMECEPGAEAQVDFGRGAPVVAADGKRKSIWVFRIVLSHSRKGYAEVVHRQSTDDFLRALENAFAHCGGVPRTLDQLQQRQNGPAYQCCGRRVYNSRMLDMAQNKDLRAHAEGSIYCAVNHFQRRLQLRADHTVEGENTSDERTWYMSDDGALEISGEAGIACTLEPDREFVFQGRLNSARQASAILVPKTFSALDIATTNTLEIRVFGQKRSGHHAVMGWLAGQFGGDTFFFNDCIPFLDPFRNHVNTSGFIAKYRGLVNHGLVGRRSDEIMPEATDEEALRINRFRRQQKSRLIVSFEDFNISCYEPHIVPPRYVGGSRKIVNVLILRDPFNHLASTIRFHGGELGQGAYQQVISLWKQYAREVLSETNFLEHKICVSYNRWFANRSYRDGIASAFGIKNRDVGLTDISPNGGGSSFNKMAYQGNAQAMPVMSRWTEFAHDPRFLGLFADPELARYANLLFGDAG